MNFVFITTQPLHDNTHKKFDYSYYEERGITTFLLDLSQCIYEKNKLEKIYKLNKLTISNHIKIKEISEFKKNIKDLSSDSLFFIITKTITNRIDLQHEIISDLNNHSCNYVIQDSVNPEVYALHKLWLHRLKRYIKIKFKFYSKLNKDFQPKFVLAAGLKTRQQYSKLLNSNYVSVKSMWINSCKNDKNHKTKDYSIFLEECVISSPDTIILNLESCVENQIKYFKYINHILLMIEQLTGIKTIISASGKHIYEDNPFDGREIIYGESLEMIRNSKFVLCHNSISFLQAVFDMKPILFIDYDYRESNKRNIIRSYQKILGSQIIKYPFTDQFIKYEELFSLSENSKNKYECFITDYLQENTHSKDVKNYLLTLLKNPGMKA